MKNVIIEASPINPATGLTVTVRMTGAGSPANVAGMDTACAPVITGAPKRKVTLFSDGQVQPVSISHGSFEFVCSQDRGSQAWSSYEWNGALARVWIGEEGDPLSSYEQWFEGSCGPLVREGNRATVTLTGPEADLDVELLTASYAGTGGAEGDLNAKGKLKPIAYGACLNVEPVLIDAAYQIYQVHDGAVYDVAAVYENAFPVAETASASVTSYTALRDLTLAPGQWAKANQVGMFRLGGEPAGKLTADVNGALDGNAFVGSVSSIVAAMIARTGVPASKIDKPSLDAFSDRAWSFYSTAQATVGDVVRDAYRHAGGYLFPSSTGVWMAGDWFATGAPIALRHDRSTLPLVRAISQPANSPPSYRVKIGCDPSWSVHSADEISEVLRKVSDDAAAANQAANDALDKAEQSAADSAQALSQLDAIGSDGVLDRSEKAQAGRDWQQLSAEKAGINAQATGFAITTENSAYDAAFTALSNYLGGLVPAFTDATQNTAINRAAWNSTWNAFLTSKTALLSKIAAVAAVKAEWPTVTGPGRPQDGATVGAPPGTSVGDRPVEDVLDDIEDTKEAVAVIPAITADVADLKVDVGGLIETYGSVANAQTSAQLADEARALAQAAKASAEQASGLATTARDQAAGSAQAATDQAAISAAKAGEAGESAAAALESRTQSATNASNAATYLGQANSAKNDAAGSAAAAALSANVAAFASSSGRGLTRNATFDNGANGWGASRITFANRAAYGYTARSDQSAQASIVGEDYIAINPARAYRLSTKFIVHDAPQMMYAGLQCFSNTGAFLGQIYVGDVAGQVRPHGQFYAFEGQFTGTVTPGGSAPWYGYTTSFYPGTATVRMLFLANWENVPGGITDIQELWLEDVTESVRSTGAATIAQNASTNATEQAAAALQSANLSASITPGSSNKDPFFTNWTANGSGLDGYNWSWWIVAPSIERVAGLTARYAMKMRSTAGVESGLMQVFGGFRPGHYVLEAIIRLESGTLRGAGIHMHPVTGNGSGNNDFKNLSFYGDQTIDGKVPLDGIPGTIYRFSKIVEFTTEGVNANLHQMQHWTGFGTIAGDMSAANEITWFYMAARPASKAEVDGYKSAAEVNTLSGALADINGRQGAFLQQSVSVGGSAAQAFVTLNADLSRPDAAPLTPFVGRLSDAGEMTTFADMDGARTIRRTGGGGDSWNVCNWTSVETYGPGCYIACSPPRGVAATVAGTFWGLNSSGNSGPAYSYLPLVASWHFSNDGTARIYEGGNHRFNAGAYKDTDVYSVEYTNDNGGSFIYRKNGAAVPYQPTNVGVNIVFRAMANLYRAESYIRNAVFGPSAPVVTSSIALGAKEIALYTVDGADAKLALNVANGTATFGGNIRSTGKIVMGNGSTGWDVAVKAKQFIVSDGQAVSWPDLGYIPAYSFESTGLAPLGSGETYNVYLDNLSSSGATVRALINVPGTPAQYQVGPGVYGGGGSNPHVVVSKGGLPDASGNVYNFSGSVTGSGPAMRDGPSWIAEIYVDAFYYAKVNGVWTYLGGDSFSSANFYSTGGTKTETFTFNRAVTVPAGATDFGVSQNNGNSSVLTSVRWSAPGTAASTRTASPNGQTCKLTVTP